MNKLLHIYTIEYHTAVRTNEGELLGYKTSIQCWMGKNMLHKDMYNILLI